MPSLTSGRAPSGPTVFLSSGASADPGSLPPSTGPTVFHLHELQWCRPDGSALWRTPLTLSIARERLAVVGRNGVGKSVLARLLSGRWPPASGTLERPGSVHLVMPPVLPRDPRSVAQAMGLGEALAALERLGLGEATADDLVLAEGHWDLPARIAQALAQAGLDGLSPQAPVARLSGGERMRVALAGAMAAQADAVVLDEPSNHLDARAREWLLDWLAGTRQSVVVISHDRQLLREVDRIVELSEDGLAQYGGNYELYAERREQEADAARSALDHARNERRTTLTRLRREHEALQRRQARGRQQAREANLSGIDIHRRKEGAQAFAGREQLRQAGARAALDTAVREAAQRVSRVPEVFLALPASEVPPRKRVLQLDAVRLPHGAAGTQRLDATLSGPMRIALTGPNGCGKSTLLRVMAGTLPPAQGTVERWVRHATLDQDGGDLLPPASRLVERLRELGCTMATGDLRTRLAQLRLGADKLAQPLGDYSAGERLKAALACALWQGEPAQLLLLDEPTNHLDLDTTLVLQAALQSFHGALVVASHDPDFIEALRPTHRWRWQGGRFQMEVTSAIAQP
jgi:ATPase subunit of ABC transporter with duplicated ATPase domains